MFALPINGHAAGRVFYTDFESGTTTGWSTDSPHADCTVVTSAADGVRGPYAGTYMLRCNSNGTNATYESLVAPSFSMANEVLYRFKFRVDRNHDSTFGSTHKVARIFYYTGNSATYVDIFDIIAGVGAGAGGVYNDMILDGNRQGGSLYWGDNASDHTADPANWHETMYYVHKGTGVAKVWHDGILVRNHTAGAVAGQVGEGGDFYITSNWEDAHDATNYVYFDNVEIYTDNGTGGTGSLALGTITQGGGGGGGDTTPPTSPAGVYISQY